VRAGGGPPGDGRVVEQLEDPSGRQPAVVGHPAAHGRVRVVAEPFDAWRGVVVLDTRIHPELQAEGWARDFTRLVQSARKQAGFNVTDRVEIVASVAPELEHALREFKTYVTGETLAVRFDLVAKGALGSHGNAVEEEIDGYHVAFVVTRMAA